MTGMLVLAAAVSGAPLPAQQITDSPAAVRASVVNAVLRARQQELGQLPNTFRCALLQALGGDTVALDNVERRHSLRTFDAQPCSQPPATKGASSSTPRWEVELVEQREVSKWVLRARYVVPCSRAREEVYTLQTSASGVNVTEILLRHATELACQPLLPAVVNGQLPPDEMANLVTSVLLTRYSRFSDNVPVNACGLQFAFRGPPRFGEHAHGALAHRIRGEVSDWCADRLATPREVGEMGTGWYFRGAEQEEPDVLTFTSWVITGWGSHRETYTFRRKPTSAWYLEGIRLSDFVYY